MNPWGNLFCAHAEVYQVTAQVSCLRDGWQSSRQVRTTLLVADSPEDAAYRMSQLVWLSDDTSTDRRMVASVELWTRGVGAGDTFWTVTVVSRSDGSSVTNVQEMPR